MVSCLCWYCGKTNHGQIPLLVLYIGSDEVDKVLPSVDNSSLG